MASVLKTLRLEPPHLGFDVDSAPSSVSKQKAITLSNFLTGDKGRIRIRGPLDPTDLAVGTANYRIAGAAYGADVLLLGFKHVNSGTRIIEPWVAPYKPSAASALALEESGGGTGIVKIVNLLTGVITTPGMSSGGRVNGPAWTRYGKFTYSVSYGDDATSIANGRNGFEWVRSIARWDVTSILQPTQYAYVGKTGQDIRVHYGRLMQLGGTQPDNASTIIRHNRIWYTQQLDASDFSMGFSPRRNSSTPALRAVGNVAADDTAGDAWTDEISGSSLVLDLPGDQGDFGVKMAAVGRNLAVFGRNKILLLSGYGPSTWQFRTAAEGIGCLDPRSVVEASEGCFFLSQQGYMFFDGQQFINVSKGLDATLLGPAITAVGDPGTAGGYAVATRLTRDHILLTIGVVGFAASPPDPTTTFCGLYHIPSNSWANFQSAALLGGLPYWVGATETKQYMADKTNIRRNNAITVPTIAAEANRGADSAAGVNPITTGLQTRMAELAPPGSKAHVTRVIVDYEYITDGDLDEASVFGPTIMLVHGDLATVLATYQLPTGPADIVGEVGSATRKRHIRDVFADANELFVILSLTAVADTTRFTIQDIWIEYQIAQERSGSLLTQ